MPTQKKSIAEAMSQVALASIQGSPPPRSVSVTPLTALVEAETHLKTLKADYAQTVEEQIRVEKTGKASAELLGSKAVLAREIESAERRLLDLNRAQAAENYASDAATWFELSRQRCLLVLALRQVNAALEARYRSYRSGGTYAEPPGYFGLMLGGAAPWSYLLLGTKAAPGRTGLCVREFLRQAVANRFLDPKEAIEDDD